MKKERLSNNLERWGMSYSHDEMGKGIAVNWSDLTSAKQYPLILACITDHHR
jgi:hypothetical protein